MATPHGRGHGPFDTAPVPGTPPVSTLNRHAIAAALHRLGIPDDHARTIAAALQANQIPFVTYSEA